MMSRTTCPSALAGPSKRAPQLGGARAPLCAPAATPARLLGRAAFVARQRSIPVPKEEVITRTDSQRLQDMEERFRMADQDK